MENNNGQTRKQALCFLSGVCALLLTLSLVNGAKALCHELHCRDKDGQEVLVYADTQEEKEADLRLLFTADDGTLAK